MSAIPLFINRLQLSNIQLEFYEQTRNLEENHPHSHHYPNCYRYYLWSYIVYVV